MDAKEKYNQKFNEMTLFTTREFTLREHADALEDARPRICRLVAGDSCREGMYFGEAADFVTFLSHRYDLQNNPDVVRGITALKALDEQNKIITAGVSAEECTFKKLKSLDPSMKVYHNIHVTNGEEETELDAVVLTPEGLTILEIKSVRGDVTLDNRGNLLRSGHTCHDKVPLCENMARKRNLLKAQIDEALKAQKSAMRAIVSSMIVFVPPRGTIIQVKDLYKKEPNCRLDTMNYKLEASLNRPNFGSKQLEKFDGILSAMERNVVRFAPKQNYLEIRLNLVRMLAALDGSQEEPVPESAAAGTAQSAEPDAAVQAAEPVPVEAAEPAAAACAAEPAPAEVTEPAAESQTAPAAYAAEPAPAESAETVSAAAKTASVRSIRSTRRKKLQLACAIAACVGTFALGAFAGSAAASRPCRHNIPL